MNFIFSCQNQCFTPCARSKYIVLPNKTHIFAPPCNILGISAYFPVKHSCRYNKKNITRRLEDMNFFIFMYQKQYVTSCARSKNTVLQPKIKFISSRHRVMSPLSYMRTTQIFSGVPMSASN